MTNLIVYKDTELYVESLAASELARRYGTPLYVYSLNTITQKVQMLQNGLKGKVKVKILYALKANSNVEILRHISSLGLGADTVSAGEIFLALKSGFQPDSISLAGVGKTDKDIAFAIDRGIGVIIAESEQEIEVISKIASTLHKPANILIRINPDVNAHTHPHISTGLRENKFGIDIRIAIQSIKKALTSPNINFVGLHTHIGSQITDINPYAEAAESISEFIRKLKVDGIEVKQIDLGGGIGVNYHNAITHNLIPVDGVYEKSIDLPQFAAIINNNFCSFECEVVIEPGRFVVADSGILITKVLYRKKSLEKVFVVVDAGMNDMMRPALYGAYHQIVPISLRKAETEVVDIVGPVCESTDAFATNRTLAHLERGDLLAIMTTGAYGYSLSSNYNSRLRPAEILVEEDYSRIIRDRETFEDLI